MIHHISIDVDDPERCARTLARLFAGRALPGIPFPWSWLAIQPDGHGTGIECLPRGRYYALANPTSAPFQVDPTPPDHQSVHVAVSVPLSEEAIASIAAEVGWTCRRRPSGGFDVVEVWVEDRFLVELLTPEMTADYLRRVGGVA